MEVNFVLFQNLMNLSLQSIPHIMTVCSPVMYKHLLWVDFLQLNYGKIDGLHIEAKT